MEDCVFCKIIKGEIPSYTLYEDDKYKVLLDRFPGSIGHCLIIPKVHTKDIFTIDTETAAGLFSLAVKIAAELKEKLGKDLGIEGMNILQNNGEAAGQTVAHFHLHLIPRRSGDDITIKWLPKDPTEDEFLKILAMFSKN